MPANNVVVNLASNFAADATGIAFATFVNPTSASDSSSGIIGSVSFSGKLTTLYTLPPHAMADQLTSDANNVYFSFIGATSLARGL